MNLKRLRYYEGSFFLIVWLLFFCGVLIFIANRILWLLRLLFVRTV